MSQNTPDRAQRATTTLIDRLHRAGVLATAEALAEQIPMLGEAHTREAVMSSADGIVADLAAHGIDCSKSKALEAIAVFKGSRNWAAYQRVLKAASASRVAPTPLAESVLDELISVDPHRSGRQLIAHYMHPADCRPQAMRVVVTGNAGLPPGTGTMSLQRGIGPSQKTLASLSFDRGAEGFIQAMTKLADDWSKTWRESLSKDLDPGQREGLRLLFQAGFQPIHTGGGIMLWGLAEGGITYRIGDPEEADGLDVSTDRPVLLDISASDVETEEAFGLYETDLANALSLVRFHIKEPKIVTLPAPR